MSVVVRRAVGEDAKPMAAVMQGWLEETPWIPVLHTLAETEAFCVRLVATTECWVAEEAGGVCGFLTRDGNWINALYLAPEARGRGVGSALLRRAMTGCDALQLWCFQQNDGARRFYERHGFVTEEFTDGAGNDEKLPDIRYVWRKARETSQ